MSLLAPLFFTALLLGSLSLIAVTLAGHASRIRDALLFQTYAAEDHAAPLPTAMAFQRTANRSPVAANANVRMAALPLAA
jgi:hypothetical protein